MKNKSILISNLLLGSLVCLVSMGIMIYLYIDNDFFRSFFTGSSELPVIGEVAPESPQSLQSKNALVAIFSFIVFSGIIIMQLVALFLARYAFKSIMASGSSDEVKMKKLKSAEIFIDLPLYIGLFGTVSGLLMMAYSSQNSLLIAYSSTLVGIIFSICLRISLLYRAQMKLLNDKPAAK